MITPSDRDYKTTKRIKQGKKRLSGPLAELAQWVRQKWNVNVLNVEYDRRNSLHAPRIQVVVEHETEARKFHRGVNFDKEKQEAVAAKFIAIISTSARSDFDVDGLFVIFSAFAPIAKQEADSQIADEEIDALKTRIGNADIWEISRCFGNVTVFFYTDDQVRRYEVQGKKKEYAKMYFALLKPHDEFDYLQEQDFKITFDSKQNFDDKYKGSWFNYYH